MSNLLGAQNVFTPAVVQATDERARPTWFRWSDNVHPRRADWEDGVLWPTSRLLSGDRSVPLTSEDLAYGKWSPFPQEGGSQRMLKFQGITRDSAGAVLANAVVQAFLTTSGLFLRQVTSDAGGWFELPSEYSGTNHFLVAYKPGSPDVAGTTVNTLQPV